MNRQRILGLIEELPDINPPASFFSGDVFGFKFAAH